MELKTLEYFPAVFFFLLPEYPELFKELWKLSGRYTIKLKDNVTPFALSTPRVVAVPHLTKVREELDCITLHVHLKSMNQQTGARERWWSQIYN